MLWFNTIERLFGCNCTFSCKGKCHWQIS